MESNISKLANQPSQQNNQLDELKFVAQGTERKVEENLSELLAHIQNYLQNNQLDEPIFVAQGPICRVIEPETSKLSSQAPNNQPTQQNAPPPPPSST